MSASPKRTTSRFQRRRESWSGWNAAFPFVVLLVALSYAPYASQRATVDAALSRERSRHSLLVSQVALRIEEEGWHVTGSLQRLARHLSDLPVEDSELEREVDGTWEMLRQYYDVAVLRVFRPGEGLVTARGSAADDASVDGLADQALRLPDQAASAVWAVGPQGLHLGIALAVPDDRGRAWGAVVAEVDLNSLIERLFRSGAQESGVSFTLMSSRGDVLMHSGLAQMPAAASAGTCGRCHEDLAARERTAGRAGDGTVTIEGVERVVAYAPVRVGTELWTISASTPVSDVLRPVAQQTIISLFFTFSVVVLLLLLGVLLRRGHIRQIRLEHRLAAQEKLLSLAREQERLQSELEASRRMALVGEMVARVAHEVKNPLQYIGTAVDLLGSTTTDPVASELIGDMRTGVRTLDAIVRELLDFTRPMQLDRTPVDLNDLAREVADRVVPDGVERVVEAAPDLPAVPIDLYKMRQVLENLVRNAVEALPGEPGRCPPGPGTLRRVTLSTRPLRDGPWAGGAAIRIEDTGCGIREADLERIWDPFWTTKTRGSGLGLAVVRRIVEAHGGAIRVESRPREGTAFEVLLPLSPPVRPPPSAEHESRS